MIYLDNAATTNMFEDSVNVYKTYAHSLFFNAQASYSQGVNVQKDIKKAKANILNKLCAKCGDVIFTSGATESDNLAILGSVRNRKEKYIFSLGEHPAVYYVATYLQDMGKEVAFIPMQPNGQIDYQALSKMLDETVRLISVMHVSNETGAINNIEEISKLKESKCKDALLHIDGVQAFCKLTFVLPNGVDMYSICGHKFHGPKGVGALYVKDIKKLKNINYGGGQESGIRSGTENVPAIMAMDYVISNTETEKIFENVKNLNKIMRKALKSDNIKIREGGSPYILSASFKGVNGETLMHALEEAGVIVSTGSACSSKKQGNRILSSLGEGINEIKSSIRISFNAFQTEEEIESAGIIIKNTYEDIYKRVN